MKGKQSSLISKSHLADDSYPPLLPMVFYSSPQTVKIDGNLCHLTKGLAKKELIKMALNLTSSINLNVELRGAVA